jgi:hypothetical protein
MLLYVMFCYNKLFFFLYWSILIVKNLILVNLHSFNLILGSNTVIRDYTTISYHNPNNTSNYLRFHILCNHETLFDLNFDLIYHITGLNLNITLNLELLKEKPLFKTPFYLQFFFFFFFKKPTRY